jgi:hypothetical protein
MANVFIYTPEGSSAPTLADRDANRLIAQLADLYGRPAPASVEDVEAAAEERKSNSRPQKPVALQRKNHKLCCSTISQQP